MTATKRLVVAFPLGFVLESEKNSRICSSALRFEIGLARNSVSFYETANSEGDARLLRSFFDSIHFTISSGFQPPFSLPPDVPSSMDDPSKDSPVHRPVLVREVLEILDLHSGLTVADGTVGAGGHSREILKIIGPEGVLLGLDRDPMMLGHASRVLSEFPGVRLVRSSYANLSSVMEEQKIATVDRILLDLGLSSDQLADESRGFGFNSKGDLDLRFDVSQGQPAWKILENSTEKQLENIFREYGEERFARQISKRFVETRRRKKLRSAKEIAESILEAIPKSVTGKSEKNPATRIFQALRIAVNKELDHLIQALEKDIPDSLKSGGIVAVITFHSLEDRIVKQHFRDKTRWETLTSKPIQASQIEIKMNPRSRTAKLRAAKKR